jgi:hypothetical protein
MSSNSAVNGARRNAFRGVAVVLALGLSSLGVSAQGNRDNRDRNRNITKLDPGMTITIRANDTIDAARTDYRVYTGTVDRDVRGDNGQLAIPRGSTAELIVRNYQGGDLLLDLESVSVNGQRYAVKTDSTQIATNRNNDIVGAIVGAIRGGAVRGPAVRIPRGTVMSFRLERPLEMGVADLGVDRNGHHYHDYYGRGRGGQ